MVLSDTTNVPTAKRTEKLKTVRSGPATSSDGEIFYFPLLFQLRFFIQNKVAIFGLHRAR